MPQPKITLNQITFPDNISTIGYAAATGTTLAYVATISPIDISLVNGRIINLYIGNIGTNTSTTPTLNLNGLGAVTIVKDGSSLEIGDMPTVAQLQYDNLSGNRWLLLNPTRAELVGQIIMTAVPTAPYGFLACNGALISRTSYSQLFNKLVTEPGYGSKTFTVTIATTAVFTCAAHGFTGGERIRLSTTGALPTGLTTTTEYFVIYVSTSTFNLTATQGGTVGLTTSGTQSGTHSLTQSLYGLGDRTTTFALPDFRGVFLRGVDSTRGLDTSRILGSYQTDLTKSHQHLQNYATLGLWDGGASGYGASVQGFTPGIYFSWFGTAGSVVNTNATGGTETRPTNVAVNYCIRYK